MKNDFFLHRFSSNNLKDFNETLAFDVDFGEYSLLLHVEKQHEFFVFSSDAIIDHNNYYGISSARQVRVEGTRKFNLKHNGCPLKLDLGHYLITINFEDLSMWVKNNTYLINKFDQEYIQYQVHFSRFLDDILCDRVYNKLTSNLFWNRYKNNSNDEFLLFALKMGSADSYNKDSLDENVSYDDISNFINLVEESDQKTQIIEELRKYNTIKSPVLQLLINGKWKKCTKRDVFSLSFWYGSVFMLHQIFHGDVGDNMENDLLQRDINNKISTQMAVLRDYPEIIDIEFPNKLIELNNSVNQIDVFCNEDSLQDENELPWNLIKRQERFEAILKSLDQNDASIDQKTNVFFFYMTSPFLPGLEKNKIAEDIRNSQFAKDIQRKYNDFCATFQIPNEHKFSYEDVATTILKDSDFQHYYYEKETCNFDLTIYQIEKLYSLLRDGKYVVEDCDIRNLSCALTGKYDGDMVFKKIRWQNTHDSLALMIGLLQDKASSTSSKFHWKNLDGLFIINGVDVDGIKLNVAYNRYKRQPPKKRKEMERIIDKILSLNETVGKENEEN